MRNVWLVMLREIGVRVRRKAFIVSTVLTPILFAALMLLPAFLMYLDSGAHYTVGIVDRSDSLGRFIENRENMGFVRLKDCAPKDFEAVVRDSSLSALAVIDSGILSGSRGVTIYAEKTPSVEVKTSIAAAVNDALRAYKMERYSVIPQLDSIMRDVAYKAEISTVVWGAAGEEKASSTELVAAIGYVLGFVIYFLIFASGNMVMSGVMEEKSTRIVEVLLSSVRSVDLMFGKILGVGAVMVIQLLLWGVLTLFFSSVAVQFLPSVGASGMANMLPVGQANGVLGDMQSMLTVARGSFGAINLGAVLLNFLLFALLGYLLYAAIFAAVGSAVEDQNDTGQLMLPITVPLLIALLGLIMVVKSPDGSVGFWLSIIPLTSPVIMPVRVAAGAPLWEVLLSALFLVVTMVVVLWLAARIYRQGILRFGRKHSWKEMLKWIWE